MQDKIPQHCCSISSFSFYFGTQEHRGNPGTKRGNMKVIIRLMKGGPLLDDVPVAEGDTMADLWRKIREEKTFDSRAKLLHGKRGEPKTEIDANDLRTLEEVSHTELG